MELHSPLTDLNVEETAYFVEKIRADPVWWAENVVGLTLEQYQKDFLIAIRDHQRVAIGSCFEIGKSFSLAVAALWWYSVFEDSIVITTATTGRQVKKILWKEIRKIYKKSKHPLGGVLMPEACEIKKDDEWYMLGFSSDEGVNVQGLHTESARVLVIIDEADSFKQDIWDSLEGLLASETCHLVSSGNPLNPSGAFKKEFKTPGTKCFNVSAFETRNFTQFGITEEDIAKNTWKEKITGDLPCKHLISPHWVRDKFVRWGPKSPLYISKVKGQFPEISVDALIPIGWITEACNRKLDAKGENSLGVDVARMGDDFTIIVHAHGPKARVISSTNQEDTMTTAGRVVQAFKDTKASCAKIDTIGVGGGVADRLRELKHNVYECIASEKAIDDKMFFNKRAEWGWRLRERFQSGDIDIDPEDTELIAQLSSMRYKPHSDGRIILMKKEDMKKEGLPSPDRFDALAMAFAEADSGLSTLRKMVKM